MNAGVSAVLERAYPGARAQLIPSPPNSAVTPCSANDLRGVC